MLTETIWKALAENPNLRQAASSWVNELLDKPFTELQKLPATLEGTPPDTVCQPRLDFGEITPSYLDFLRREVRVRGKFGGEKVEKLYQSRLDALIPYENKNLFWMYFFKSHKGSLAIAFRPEDFQIVHIE